MTVVEGDACQFAPPEGKATLVTFSYSLTSERRQRLRQRSGWMVVVVRVPPLRPGCSHLASALQAQWLTVPAPPRHAHHARPAPAAPLLPPPHSDPSLPRRRGPRHLLPRPRGRPAGRLRLLRLVQVSEQLREPVRPLWQPGSGTGGQAVERFLLDQRFLEAAPSCSHLPPPPPVPPPPPTAGLTCPCVR